MSRRSAAASLLAAVFFAGAAATLGVMRIVEHQGDPGDEHFVRTEARDVRRDRPPGDRPDGMRQGQPTWTELAHLRITGRLVRELELTEEQQEGIHEAMERSRADAQQFWAEVLPLLASRQDSLEAEIARILTPEQSEVFLRFLRADRERTLRGRGPRRSPSVGRR